MKDKNFERTMSRLDKYLSRIDRTPRIDYENLEPNIDDLNASGLSIDERCILSGRVLG
jgi:hypothetical protein